MGASSPERNSRVRAIGIVAAIAALILLALGWWTMVERPAAPVAVDVPPTGGLSGYNLLLISIDALRADHLRSYGYQQASTPNIDRLAGDGVRFNKVATTVPITLPAHASIMTGQYPYTHGVRDNGSFVLPDNAVTLAEVLAASGYATGGFVGAEVLDPQFGIAQGFGTYTGAFDADAGERRGEAVAGEAIEWIRKQRTPFFAWVHMYDLHAPYEPPEPYSLRYPERPYDGELEYVDALIGRLRVVLDSTGHADDTLIVLTADHGEGLGDHNEQRHAFFIYDSTLRVPLIFWAPGAVPGGVVVEGQASVVDIFPTVLALLGVTDTAWEDDAADAAMAAGRTAEGIRDGVDLRGAFVDPDSFAGVAYAENLAPSLDFGWSDLRALIDADGFKLIEAPRPELYDLGADPGERNNLAATDPGRVAAMRAVLQEMIENDIGVPVGRRRVDPKDKVDVYEVFHDELSQVTAAIDEARWADARNVLARMDADLPGHYVVYYYGGRVARLAGDPQGAVALLRPALGLNPSYFPTFTELASALYAAGDRRGAQLLLLQGERAFPGSFTLRLLSGAFYHDGGELQAAFEAYQAAAAIRPDDPELLERMAQLPERR